MPVDIESIKLLINQIADEAYEDGWKDCKENISLQKAHNEDYEVLRKSFIVQKRKLNLAIKLLRYAQMTECGKNGQFDRFFQEYSEDYDREVGQWLIDIYS